MRQLVILLKMAYGLIPALYNYYWVDKPRRAMVLRLLRNRMRPGLRLVPGIDDKQDSVK